MRNLRCISRVRHNLESHLPLTASTWDTVNDAIIYALGPKKDEAVIELRSLSAQNRNNEQSKLLASWDAPCPLPELEADQIVSLHHLVASETTCLVLAGGDIVIVRSAPLPGQEKIEIVGSVDVGINTAAWSPDEDLLAIATRANTLLFMTAEFDNIASATFDADDAKLSNQVSVGWGKRETQFQGKRAKALCDPTVPEQVDEGLPSPNEDGRVSVSWRGDGAFVAVNTVEPQNRRMIRVYSREGALDSVSEAVDGLEGSIAWKPSGQLIAGVRRFHGESEVIFFERNGLRHGEFSLRLSKEDLATWATHIGLAWNRDSTVLAVSFADRVQLWTMGNYHYYLKQEIFVQILNGILSSTPLEWHPENPLRIQFEEAGRSVDSEVSQPVKNGSSALTDRDPGAVSVTKLAWSLSESPVVPPQDLGMMLVSDGCTLRITPIRQATVPPPMAFHEISLPSNAVDASISSDNRQIAVLHRDSVSIFEYKNGCVTYEPVLSKQISLAHVGALEALQVCITIYGRIYVLLHDAARGSYQIHQVGTEGARCVFEDDANTIQIGRSSDQHRVHILSDNRLMNLQYSHEKDSIHEPLLICRFPAQVIQIQSCNIDQQSTGIGLTENGILYANEHVLLRNCTSFLVTQMHLILTTASHLLKFVHLNGSAKDLQVPPDEPELDERCRNVERSAKLVAVMPSTCAVTLQMPRGNLETIYPRALVVAGIRRSIDKQQYKKAFLTCRNHRVDMNILHDYKPGQFLASVPLVVKQFAKTEYIDLFLSQLIESDVSLTLYRNTLSDHKIDGQPNGDNRISLGAHDDPVKQIVSDRRESKINRVCNAFLETFAKDGSQRLQNIITANVCKNPPDIEAGLTVIAGLRDIESTQVETAIEHICFLTDINKIYEAALGMYNLDLALGVAQQSQKDPREYLPYLQNLQSMSEQERRFHIDDDLKRCAKALGHLQSLADHDRFLAYTEKHELHQTALSLNRYDAANHARILKVYADFLNSRNRYSEAAIAYESLSLYPAAATTYASAQMWRESLASAYLSQMPADAVNALAQSLADTLIESKSYSSAATILSEHLHKFKDAASTYCKGYHFSDAVCLLALHGHSTSIPDVMDVELAEAFSNLTDFISDCRSQISAQIPRIRELREKKERDPLAFFEGSAEAGTGEDVPDNISLAPSETSTAGGTLLTRYTGRNSGTVATGTSRRTSKNRRREERKRARGKKGSVYEEEYLVNSVGRLIERVNETQGDVQRTIEAMCRRGMWERARTLQGGSKELVEGCEKCIPEIWVTPAKEIGAQPEDEDGSGRPLGADGVLWDSIEDAKRERPAPTMKSFASSALLSG